jgi:cytochrome c oxidase subunit 2|tara:strand:- start:318 stop:1157 length:840 start_codon:yes stop_codon:yes gene_type:complete
MAEILHYLGLPINMSVDGPAIDEVIILTHWLMLVLFIGWGAFFIVSLVKFRSSKNPNADHDGVKSHFSSVLEVVVAVIEMMLLVGFALPIWASRINNVPEVNSGAVHARVVAQQFAWNIHYPGEDGIFGQTRPNLVDEVENPIGLDRSSTGGADDFVTINQLHIPVDTKIRLDLTSKDVIHSFSLPELRVKQDAIPGMIIPVHFEATMTSEEFLAEMVGTPRESKGLEISCAQLCGLGHYRMRGFLTIHDDQGYADWIEEQKAYIEEEDDEDDWDDDDW